MAGAPGFRIRFNSGQCLESILLLDDVIHGAQLQSGVERLGRKDGQISGIRRFHPVRTKIQLL